jgi:hypothetical protein
MQVRECEGKSFHSFNGAGEKNMSDFEGALKKNA